MHPTRPSPCRYRIPRRRHPRPARRPQIGSRQGCALALICPPDVMGPRGGGSLDVRTTIGEIEPREEGVLHRILRKTRPNGGPRNVDQLFLLEADALLRNGVL